MRPTLIVPALSLLLSVVPDSPAAAGGRDRAARFHHDGNVVSEIPVAPEAVSPATAAPPSEAPTGFDNLTNGYLEQGPDFETLDEDDVVAAALVQRQPLHLRGGGRRRRRPRPDLQRAGCRECHQNVVTGGASQITEHRTGRLNGDDVLRVARRLADPLAGDGRRRSSSAWPSRTTSAPSASRRTRSARASSRRSPTRRPARAPRRAAFGAARQRRDRARCSRPAVSARVGRFGWKSQHASLESVRGRRLPERDGHHEPAAARRRTPRAGASSASAPPTTRCPIPRTTAST